MVRFKHFLLLLAVSGLAVIMLSSQISNHNSLQYIHRDTPTNLNQITPSPTTEDPSIRPVSNQSSEEPPESLPSPTITISPEPTQTPMTETERQYWMTLASNAWQYFQPGVGVDANTGLDKASYSDYPHFTDWDLGSYVQAIVEAGRLGIIQNDGAWGFDARVEKILVFLETRQLSTNNEPFDRYNTADGSVFVSIPQYATDAANLFVGLKNIIDFRPDRPDWASRIHNILNVRTNYELQKQAVDSLINSVNIYDYFVTRAFAQFWPERFSAEQNTILSNICNAPTVNYSGVLLPSAKLTCEPLLLSIFGFSNDQNLMSVTRQVYLAHEAYYNNTGHFVAFSEGNPVGLGNAYIWEWVVLPDNRTWVILKSETEPVTLISPMVFFKAAVGLDAIYGTPFTRAMTDAPFGMVPQMYTGQGYREGLGENGQMVPIITDKTNSMILSAARYAIENGDATPTPTPTTTPTVTPTPTTPPTSTPTQAPTSTPTPTPTPTQTPSPTPSPSPTPVPSVTATPTPPTPTPSPTPTQTPSPTPTTTSTPTATVTPTPTQNVTPDPTPIVPEYPIIAIVVLVVVAAAIAVVITQKRKT